MDSLLQNDDVNFLTNLHLLGKESVDAITPDKNGHTLLHRACKNISKLPLSVFKLLLETHGANINAIDLENATPIHIAFDEFSPDNADNVAILTYLLSQENLNPNLSNDDGYSLLHCACRYINQLPIDVFKFLIETRGANINLQCHGGDIPFHFVFRSFQPNDNNDFTIFTYLLGQKAVNANHKGRDGYTLLHWACMLINKLPISIFKLLIETHCVDVNALDLYNETPLHYAFISFRPSDGGDIAILHYLLSLKDVNANIQGQMGYTLLHLACLRINLLPLSVFKCLIEQKGCDLNFLDKNTNQPSISIALGAYSSKTDVSILIYLLDQENIDFNAKYQDGSTFLHKVCRNINQAPLSIFKYLIEKKGCSMNILDEKNNTPLYYALHFFIPGPGDDSSALTYLINNNNFDVNITSQSNQTLFHYACIMNLSPLKNRRSARDLVEEKANLDSFWSQIIEIGASRYLELVLDEKTH
jgi:ankyrin repeat protein